MRLILGQILKENEKGLDPAGGSFCRIKQEGQSTFSTTSEQWFP